MKKKMAILVSLMMVASAGTALAWGPNDPTDGKADPDGDRLGNLKEFRLGTNPLKPDTDGGGCWDGWEFLYGLEATGCVGPRTGWVPRFIIVKEGGRLVGALPLYLRGDSYGEYIFDWEWAHAYERAGIRYYPKASVAVPCTYR